MRHPVNNVANVLHGITPTPKYAYVTYEWSLGKYLISLLIHIRLAGIIFFSWPFIKRSKHIRPKVTRQKCVGIIRMQELFKGRSYMRKYGISGAFGAVLILEI